MNEASFNRLLGGFMRLEFGAEDPGSPDARSMKPGEWLVDTLGVSLTAVGLGYRDGAWARRYLQRVDTRSPEEMQEWDHRSARAWLRRNADALPEYASPDVRQVLGNGIEFDSSSWQAVTLSVDWDRVGIWGPDDSINKERLRRVQAIFVLGRLISEEVSSHGAFSFMVGSNRELGGHSPLMYVGAFSYTRFEDVLMAADSYIGAGL